LSAFLNKRQKNIIGQVLEESRVDSIPLETKRYKNFERAKERSRNSYSNVHTQKEEEEKEESTNKEMTTNVTPPPPSEGEGEGGEPFRVGTHTKATTTKVVTTDPNEQRWFDPDELTPRESWEKIGDGSFGKVYRAHLLGAPVAVKVIQNLKPDRVAGLKRDMFYLSRLTHPNVVPVYGAFVEEGMLHMVMEFVPNSLRNKRVVNQVNVVKVLADVARALVRIHAQGHIHRDVKARNVLISAVRGRERRFFFQLRPIRCRESQSLTLFLFSSLLSLSLSLSLCTHASRVVHAPNFSSFFPTR
jgi:hypothetical protein